MRRPVGQLRHQFFLHRQPEVVLTGQFARPVRQIDNVDQHIHRFRQCPFAGQLHQWLPNRHLLRPELAVEQDSQRTLGRLAVAGGVDPDVAAVARALALPVWRCKRAGSGGVQRPLAISYSSNERHTGCGGASGICRPETLWPLALCRERYGLSRSGWRWRTPVPPVAQVVHVGVRIVAAERRRPLVKARDKAVAAAPGAAQLGLPVPHVGAGQTLQALRRIRLMMVGQAVDVDPHATVGGGQFASLRIAPEKVVRQRPLPAGSTHGVPRRATVNHHLDCPHCCWPIICCFLTVVLYSQRLPIL